MSVEGVEEAAEGERKEGEEGNSTALLYPPALRSIAWSSRILASLRAAETLRTSSPPLVVDPLASLLSPPPPPPPSIPNPLPPQTLLPYSSRSHVHLHHTHHLFRSHQSTPPSLLTPLTHATLTDSFDRPDTLIRCRYIDQLLTSHLREGHQLVLLGAGLDTRAWRLNALNGVRVYEVDLPPVLSYKQSVLGRAECERLAQSVEFIHADLRTPPPHLSLPHPHQQLREREEAALDMRKSRDRRALRAIHKRQGQGRPPPQPPTSAHPLWSTSLQNLPSFSSTSPTVWVLEGVAMYLTRPQLEWTVEVAASMCGGGSVLVMDHVTRREGRWHKVFSSEMEKEEAAKMMENAGWRVGDRRGKSSQANEGGGDGAEERYQIGDGMRCIGRDDLSYGRYLRDRMRVQRKDGKGEVEVESYIVTAMKAGVE